MVRTRFRHKEQYVEAGILEHQNLFIQATSYRYGWIDGVSSRLACGLG